VDRKANCKGQIAKANRAERIATKHGNSLSDDAQSGQSNRRSSHDIPYQVFGGLKFYERREVKDAVAALRWAAIPRTKSAGNASKRCRRKFMAFREAMMAKNNLKPAVVLRLFLKHSAISNILNNTSQTPPSARKNISELAPSSRIQGSHRTARKISLLQPQTTRTIKKKTTARKRNVGNGHPDDDSHGERPRIDAVSSPCREGSAAHSLN